MKNKFINKNFVLRIILPTLLVFSIFTTLIFALIIPSIKDYMLNDKREMIRELTNSAWSVLDKFGSNTPDSSSLILDAQKKAIKQIENMRYGSERKDYFWITDMHPNMIMHPYRTDLNNRDLSNYIDPTGKKVFKESVSVVEMEGEGYVDYMWQWKDDSTNIVHKLSFVKGFEKWGWIIGTGIYIEDVNEEISSLTSNLFYISLGILFLLGFILFFIGRQSLLIESKRYNATLKLKESETKYKALVDASTDGLVMMLDGYLIYSNNAILKMLGYEEENISVAELNRVLCENDISSGTEYFKKLVSGNLPQEQQSAQLKRIDNNLIDVIFYSSKISIGEKIGYTIIIKDVSTHKQVEEELDINKERYLTLANSIKIGVFRAIWDSNGKIVEANPSAADILGYGTKEELCAIGFFDLFQNTDDKKYFTQKLLNDGSVKNSIVQTKQKDGSISMISISAILEKDSNDNSQYINGTIDDISDRITLEEERENLIVELQTSLRFLNQPIGNFVKHFVSCNIQLPINRVAKLMTKEKFSAALVKTDSNEFIGIITDQDIRRRVVSENLNTDRPIYEVMSSPLISIHESSLVFEAFSIMNENASHHLAVKNNDNEIIGIISSEELVTVQRHSTTYLRREIENANSVDELISAHDKLPRLVKMLVDSGTRSRIIAQIVTSIFDTIAEKLISFAIAELGEPPAKFTFLALGSVGRKEQTLISDQDNAIIYENVSPDLEKLTHTYFYEMGTKVCDCLNECGYEYCPGEAMAKNPKWCQPISKWKEYFHTWITNSDQQDLIDISIFFDFRSLYGNSELSDELRSFIFETSDGQAGFFQQLAKNSLVHRPPVGLLGKIMVESKGEHQETFDIKSAIMPISDFARIYSLKKRVNNPNSLERLEGLLKKGVINKNTYEELKQAYNYLMQLRFKHQSEQIIKNVCADNYINPNELTQIEQKTLKNIFSQILSIQKKLSYDFTGEAI